MTRQISDTLIFENKKYHLNDELLEKYFRAFPDKKPEFEISCTALWRGYIATFEIKNDQFFVKEMEMLLDSDFKMKSIVNQIFPNDNKFDWFSGLIRIDDFKGEFDGEPKDAKFEYLEIKNGDLIQKRIMSFEELQIFKKEQYEYFIMSEDVNPIYELFKKNNEGITEDRINEIISEHIIFYTREVYVD